MLEPLTADTFSQLSEIRHGFFTRTGGQSKDIYTSLNCGLGSDDAREDVSANRRLVSRHLGGRNDDVVTVHQCHSADAIVIEQPLPRENLPKVDAIVTAAPGLVVGVLTADCAPVLFADGEAKIVAAAHAGWRGSIRGIVAATLEAMEATGARRDRIRAVVGPCISQKNYEVGEDFKADFVAQSSENTRFFSTPSDGGKPHFDLPAFVLAQLERAGLENVQLMAPCTYENESKFFSYRRSQHRSEPDYGRQMSAIVVA